MMNTLSDWIWGCMILFPSLALADAILRPMLARKYDLWKQEPGDDNPTLLWLCMAFFAILFGFVAFAGHAVGLS